MSLESHMLAQLQSKPDIKRWVIAYSGGLDSTALLHVVAKVNNNLSCPRVVCALHVNHQLSPFADTWQKHCQQQADQCDVDFFPHVVELQQKGQGVEAAARKARYDVFERFLQEDDCLLMAHHSDDQAETFLLRLFRGAGVLGLGAMPYERPLGKGFLSRPFLNCSREQLAEYIEDNHIRWVDDESNESIEFDRNYLRHQIMPLLTQRWQQAKNQLAKTAVRLQKAQQLLNDLAELDLQQLDERTERYGFSLDWKKCKTLDQERINNVLRFWCESKGITLPNGQQLQQIHEQFFSSNAMLTSAIVTWSNYECRQFNQRFYLMHSLSPFAPPNDIIEWDLQQCIDLDVAGNLDAKSITSDLSDATSVKVLNREKLGKTVSVRWRKGGERCTPAGRANSQLVKKLLQEYQLETWLRDRIPLIYVDDCLAAVGDLWVCDEFVAKKNEAGIQLNWILNNKG